MCLWNTHALNQKSIRDMVKVIDLDVHSCQLTPHSRVTLPKSAMDPPPTHCAITPRRNPIQKCSPPMTHNFANDAKQAYVLYI